MLEQLSIGGDAGLPPGGRDRVALNPTADTSVLARGQPSRRAGDRLASAGSGFATLRFDLRLQYDLSSSKSDSDDARQVSINLRAREPIVLHMSSIGRSTLQRLRPQFNPQPLIGKPRCGLLGDVADNCRGIDYRSLA